MKHEYKIIALSGVILGLTSGLIGCASLTNESGYFRDKSGDYVDESVTPDLVIPGNLKPVQPVEFMAIPELSIEAKISRDAETPRADRRVVREDGVVYEIVTKSDHPVLVINRPVHMVWPFLGTFWEDKGMSVAEANATQGIVITDWVQLGETSRPGFMRRLLGNVIDLENADTSQEKFRLSLHPGQRSGNSEIVLEHVRRRDGSDLTVPVDWASERHNSPMLENMLLNEVLVSLVQSRERQVASNSGGKISADQASLQQDGNGNPLLRIDLGFARSWQAVENALTTMGITIVDRNRSLGLIYIDVNVKGDQITVQPEEENSGWLDGWFSGDEEDVADATSVNSEYSVRVQSSGGATNVTLEKDLNTLPPANISRQFLEHLRESI